MCYGLRHQVEMGLSLPESLKLCLFAQLCSQFCTGYRQDIFFSHIRYYIFRVPSSFNSAGPLKLQGRRNTSHTNSVLCLWQPTVLVASTPFMNWSMISVLSVRSGFLYSSTQFRILKWLSMSPKPAARISCSCALQYSGTDLMRQAQVQDHYQAQLVCLLSRGETAYVCLCSGPRAAQWVKQGT